MLLAAMVLASLVALENPANCSASGRFCAARVAEPESPAEAILLYDGGRLISTIPLERSSIRQILVSDVGPDVVIVEGNARCLGPDWEPHDPLVTIYRTDGVRTGTVLVRDVFADCDLTKFGRLWFELRHESTFREVIVITDPFSKTERRIDVATATPLDPKTPIYEPPHVVVTPMHPREAKRGLEAGACESSILETAVVRLDSEPFLARALSAPPPEYPEVALRMKYAMVVRARVLVSERGEVVCALVTTAPLGLAEATRGAIAHWRFRPLVVDGRPRPFTGDVLVYFKQ